jgi:iron-sulfur cluster repair protein YtfE (RIC family)
MGASVVQKNPIHQFEHSHARLSALALEVRGHIEAIRRTPAPRTRKQLASSLGKLRDELLQHFADEEEALFPFVRACVQRKAAAVDELEAAHDTICGCAVRMFHVASSDRNLPSVLALYDRFEGAYARHSLAETELLDELAGVLDDAQRRALRERMRGL